MPSVAARRDNAPVATPQSLGCRYDATAAAVGSTHGFIMASSILGPDFVLLLVHPCISVEEAAMEHDNIIYWNWEIPHLFFLEIGHENASVRDGGRRRRRSPTLGDNGPDRIKARQGKPVNREANGCRRKKRRTVLRD